MGAPQEGPRLPGRTHPPPTPPCRDARSMREVETKFRVHGRYTLPDLLDGTGVAKVDGPLVEQLMATYYDTADLRLSRERITLRRRTGGHDDGWHLKLPVLQASAETR